MEVLCRCVYRSSMKRSLSKYALILVSLLFVGPTYAGVSPLFEYSTDKRLMSNIKKLGRLMSNIKKLGSLKNGLEVFSWNWTSEAGRLDKRYSSESDIGNYVNIGFIAQNIQKEFPEAVESGPDGYLRINPVRLAAEDQFMRWKLSSTARTTRGRCAKILETQLTLCF